MRAAARAVVTVLAHYFVEGGPHDELGAASFSHRMDRLINRTQSRNTSRLQSR